MVGILTNRNTLWFNKTGDDRIGDGFRAVFIYGNSPRHTDRTMRAAESRAVVVM